MDYAVGIDVGSTYTIAAVGGRQDKSALDGGPEVVEVAPSVVFVDEDGDLIFGQDAVKRGIDCPQRVIRDLKSRIGDAVPVAVDSWSQRAEAIFAALVRSIIDSISASEGSEPAAISVSHPASWGPYKRAMVSNALSLVGLTGTVLVAEPVAAASHAAEICDIGLQNLVVYDLGGSSFEATVLSGTGGTFHQLGTPRSLEWLGGGDLDQAVFTFVARSAGVKRLTDTDTDKESVEALGRLRRSCVDAKEALSMDTETTIPVVLSNSRTRVRLVRSEFEDLIRDAVDDTIDATYQAIASSGLTADDIDAVVLIGGSSRIPLVYQMLSAELARPVIIDSNPEASTALGAARMALALLPAKPEPAGLEILHVLERPVPSMPERVPLARSISQGRLETVFQVNDTDSPDPTGDSMPAGVGRHRQSHRRNWLRSVSWLAACSALVLVGSSLTASRAAEPAPGETAQTRYADGGPNGSDGAYRWATPERADGTVRQLVETSIQTAALLVAEVATMGDTLGDSDFFESDTSAASSSPSTSAATTGTSATTSSSAAPTSTSVSAPATKPATTTPSAGSPAPAQPLSIAPVVPVLPPAAPSGEDSSAPGTSTEPAPQDPTTLAQPSDPEPVPSDPPPTENEPTADPAEGSPLVEDVQTPETIGPEGDSAGG